MTAPLLDVKNLIEHFPIKAACSGVWLTKVYAVDGVTSISTPVKHSVLSANQAAARARPGAASCA